MPLELMKLIMQGHFLQEKIHLITDEWAEFGMGMKVAACWYSGDWEVETTTIGESEKRIFRCDMNKLSDDMPVDTIGGIDPNEHGTKITLRNLYRRPHGAGYGTIRNYLSDIYSWFFRNHQMKTILPWTSLIFH